MFANANVNAPLSTATDIPPDRLIKKQDWDVIYSFTTDLLRGKGTGRLLQYDPDTEQVKVLAKNILFANGVAVDKDENYVMINESCGMRSYKYHLKGPTQGTLETVIESHVLPGVVDGADCSWETSGPSAHRCYATIPTEITPIVTMLQKIPSPIDQYLRGLFMMLPKSLSPKPSSYGGIIEVDMKSGDTEIYQDPDGRDVKMLTGVTIHGNQLFLGCLHCNAVGIYDLS